MRFVAKGLLLIFMFSQMASAEGERTNYEKRRQAIDEYVRGHYREAETLFLNAMHEAEAKGDNRATAQCLIGLGDVYQNQGHYDQAQTAYKRSLAILKHVPNSDLLIAVLLHSLADSHTALFRYRDAIATLTEASRMAATATPPHSELKGLIANSFGVVYFYQGKIGKAESYFQEALRIYSSNEKAVAADIAQSTNNLAETYRRRHQLQEAEDFYKRAIALTEQELGPSHPDLTVILENLASLYTDQKRYAEAEASYRRSLAILEDGKSFLTMRVIHTLHGLSKLYLAKGDKANAVEALARAAEVIGPHPAWNPEIPNVLEAYSKLLKNTGNSQQAQDLHSRAVRALAAMTLTVRAQDLN